MAIMLPPLLISATTVELWIIYLLSVPSLVVRKSARRLVKHKPKLETLREVVDEAVEAVVDVKAEQVMEILMGNVPLGMIISQRVPTLELQILKVPGKCIVLNAVGGMKHTLLSIMMSSSGLQLRSRCHHTILIG
jgi:hypothetical protein